MDGFTIEDREQDGRKVLCIAGELTILHAAQLRAALLAAIEKAEHLTIEVEKVVAVDLTALQLLCSAHRSVCQRGGTLELKSVQQSEALSRARAMAGAGCHSGCPRGADKTCIWIGDKA